MSRSAAASVAAVAEVLADMPAAAHLAAADALAAEVRYRVPVRSGRLRNSITTSADADGGTVTVGVPYARKQERRHRYMEQSAGEGAAGVAQAYADAISDAARRG